MTPMLLTSIQKESFGMTSPPDGSVCPPSDSEIAISSPPTTTNGIM